jgi:hypothetical protein
MGALPCEPEVGKWQVWGIVQKSGLYFLARIDTYNKLQNNDLLRVPNYLKNILLL